MVRTLHGKIHGKTIKLDENPVPDGQDVEVQVKVVPAPENGDLATEPNEVDSWDWDFRIVDPPKRHSKEIVVELERGSYRPPRFDDLPD